MYRAPGVRREARVAAVCGFPGRLRVCARWLSKSLRCADVRATPKKAGAMRKPNAENPRRGGKNPPVREEPASHLASRRNAGSLPNAICRQKPIPTFTNGGNMRKNKQFSIRISEQDLNAIRRKAAQARMTQSDYVTACCTARRPRPVRAPAAWM